MFNEIEDQLNEYDGKINFDEEINKEEAELLNKKYNLDKCLLILWLILILI